MARVSFISCWGHCELWQGAKAALLKTGLELNRVSYEPQQGAKAPLLGRDMRGVV